MKTRIISGAVGCALIVLTLAFNKAFPICVNILIALATLMCTTELLNAKGLIKNLRVSVPCMLFTAITPMLVSSGYWHIPVYLFTLILFVVMLTNHEKFKFSDLAFIYTSVLIVTAGMSCIIAMCDRDRGHTGFNVTMCLVIPWAADAGAYFVGSFFGKRKLCPKISPKKTVEGAVGGIIFGVIGAIINAVIFQNFIFTGTESIHYINLFIVALIGAVISIIGDLSFSLIKRSCNVKDYGNVIPGHGGILDRCDSVIFTSSFILMFVQFLPIMTIS
ncbi:MAG TPA: CDP-archaeol synthase [Clostridiales bacterium]|nr:CDP-archaeol synthase [Clostridiales bacterium]